MKQPHAISVKVLELIECGVTAAGCEIIGELLSPLILSPLLVLRLDYNIIGYEGVEMLAKGLRMNGVLQRLCLRYCEIDFQASHALTEIVIYNKSNLKLLDLHGNKLGNDGAHELFRALCVNKSLENLVLSANQFGENPFLVNQL